MWNEEERQLAASFTKNPQTMAFLKKVYCPDRSSLRAKLEENILLTDEQYGQLMKAIALAESHFATSHANLVHIAAKEITKSSPIAPK